MRRYTSRIVVVTFKYPYLRSRQSDFDFLLNVASPLAPEALSPMFPKLKEICIGSLATLDHNISLFRYVNGPSVTQLQSTVNSLRWERRSEFVVHRVQTMLDKCGGEPPENILRNIGSCQ